MTNNKQNDWQMMQNRVIPLYEEQVALMDDMIESVKQKYHPRTITPFREICFGYLIICRNNATAALLLINHNLIHQTHYISRNMFEMVVNLYFIDNDESTRDEMLKRFFYYYRAVSAYKVLQTMIKYPSTPQTMRTPERDKEIRETFESFKKKYGSNGGKLNLNSWSGKSIPIMINEIKDAELRKNLATGYDIMNDTNNRFLHPSLEYIREAISDEIEITVDYGMKYTQLNSIMISSGMIVEKFFAHFQRSRPHLRKKYDSIDKRHKEIVQDVKEKELV